MIRLNTRTTFPRTICRFWRGCWIGPFTGSWIRPHKVDHKPSLHSRPRLSGPGFYLNPQIDMNSDLVNSFCLSVRQPWAWLICNGGKDIENRNWPTHFRGRVLIHAGKTMTRADYQACCLFVAGMRSAWRLPAYDILRQQCGGIVGETEIVGCLLKSDSPWFCGEFGFLLKNSKPLSFMPCKGQLGFFKLKPALAS